MTIIERIKNLVFSLNTGFEDLTLEDGSMIKTSTEVLEVGSKVVLVAEDGTESVPPAGTHVLSDGRSIITDEAGAVTEIREKDAPVASEETMSDDAAEEVASVAEEVVAEATEIIDAATPAEVTPEESAVIAEAVVALVEEKVAEMEVEMMKKMKEMMGIMEEMAKSQEKMSSEFSAFKKSPSGKSLSQTEFSATEEKLDPLADRIERIKALRNAKN